VYISPYCRLVLVPPNVMKFGIRGHLTDIITCVKFLVDRFRGYRVLTLQNCHFPLTCCVALTTVYALPCDTVMVTMSASSYEQLRNNQAGIPSQPAADILMFLNKASTSIVLRGSSKFSLLHSGRRPSSSLWMSLSVGKFLPSSGKKTFFFRGKNRPAKIDFAHCRQKLVFAGKKYFCHNLYLFASVLDNKLAMHFITQVCYLFADKELKKSMINDHDVYCLHHMC